MIKTQFSQPSSAPNSAFCAMLFKMNPKHPPHHSRLTSGAFFGFTRTVCPTPVMQDSCCTRITPFNQDFVGSRRLPVFTTRNPPPTNTLLASRAHLQGEIRYGRANMCLDIHHSWVPHEAAFKIVFFCYSIVVLLVEKA